MCCGLFSAADERTDTHLPLVSIHGSRKVVSGINSLIIQINEQRCLTVQQCCSLMSFLANIVLYAFFKWDWFRFTNMNKRN